MTQDRQGAPYNRPPEPPPFPGDLRCATARAALLATLSLTCALSTVAARRPQRHRRGAAGSRARQQFQDRYQSLAAYLGASVGTDVKLVIGPRPLARAAEDARGHVPGGRRPGARDRRRHALRLRARRALRRRGAGGVRRQQGERREDLRGGARQAPRAPAHGLPGNLPRAGRAQRQGRRGEVLLFRDEGAPLPRGGAHGPAGRLGRRRGGREEARPGMGRQERRRDHPRDALHPGPGHRRELEARQGHQGPHPRRLPLAQSPRGRRQQARRHRPRAGRGDLRRTTTSTSPRWATSPRASSPGRRSSPPSR